MAIVSLQAKKKFIDSQDIRKIEAAKKLTDARALHLLRYTVLRLWFVAQPYHSLVLSSTRQSKA